MRKGDNMKTSIGKKISLVGLAMFLLEAVAELVVWLINLTQMKDNIVMKRALSNFSVYIPDEARMAVLGTIILAIAFGFVFNGISGKSVLDFVPGMVFAIVAMVGMFLPGMFTGLYYVGNYEGGGVSPEVFSAIVGFAIMGFAVAISSMKSSQWLSLGAFAASVVWILIGGIFRNSIFLSMIQFYSENYPVYEMYGNAQVGMGILLSLVIIACLVVYILTLALPKSAAEDSETVEEEKTPKIQESEKKKAEKQVSVPQNQAPRKAESPAFNSFFAQNESAESANRIKEDSNNKKKTVSSIKSSASDALNDFLNAPIRPAAPAAKPVSEPVAAKSVPVAETEPESNDNDIWSAFGGSTDAAPQKTGAPVAEKKSESNDDDIWSAFGGSADTAPQNIETLVEETKPESNNDDTWSAFGGSADTAPQNIETPVEETKPESNNDDTWSAFGGSAVTAPQNTEAPAAETKAASDDDDFWSSFGLAETDSGFDKPQSQHHEDPLDAALSTNGHVFFGRGTVEHISTGDEDNYFGTLTVVKKDGAIVARGIASNIDGPTYENMLAFIPGIVTGIEAIIDKHRPVLDIILKAMAQTDNSEVNEIIFVGGKIFKGNDMKRVDPGELDPQCAAMAIIQNKLFDIYDEIASFVNEKCNFVLFEIM